MNTRVNRFFFLSVSVFSIERLWRDVWNAVSRLYYDLLHTLEEDGLLDPANSTHLFSAQYVFLPRIQMDLDAFIEGWNSHSMRTESNRTPNQLWTMGMIQTPVEAPDYIEVLNALSRLIGHCNDTNIVNVLKNSKVP